VCIKKVGTNELSGPSMRGEQKNDSSACAEPFSYFLTDGTFTHPTARQYTRGVKKSQDEKVKPFKFYPPSFLLLSSAC
jgi:hypothetical protein